MESEEHQSTNDEIRVDQSPSLDEQLHDLHMAFLSGEKDRRDARAVRRPSVDDLIEDRLLSRLFQQHLHNLHRAALCRQEERSESVSVGESNVDFRVSEENGNSVRPPFVRRKVEGSPAAEVGLNRSQLID